MNANTIQVLTSLAEKAIAREMAARQALAESLADQKQGVEPSAMRRVAEAAANALPYRMLLEDADAVDFGKAFTTLRKRLASRILHSGPGSSSCAYTNEAERLEYAGYRAFLDATQAFEETEDKPAKTHEHGLSLGDWVHVHGAWHPVLDLEEIQAVVPFITARMTVAEMQARMPRP
ncbi:hypothetical protein PV518_51890 [Streptomyces sp. ND04-05B]|uniref:hypothetical protein n=1 Tax=Streptomyces sp. ND04-05B TaxID=3028693 RepID=UPI0029A0236C|nr:hypothetical protein [Streptomyces sp. ND04-05B]MDX3070527.1 hypothetical protein [Streptomyces sp. ND04-05B]